MGARNTTPHTTMGWRGLNTFISKSNIDEQSWIDSDNVLVNAKGEAEALRSPCAFGNDLDVVDSGDSDESSPFSSEPVPIGSMDEFQRAAGNVIIIDRGEETLALTSAGGDATLIRVGSPDVEWTSLSINDTFQRIDGADFIQILANLTSVYDNGIDAPTWTPVLSYVANASDTTVVATSLLGSCAYMNSTTGHVGKPSPLSNTLGAKAAGFSLQVTVEASVQSGVDKIVFFITVDGGNIPYLVINCSDGDTYTVTNANATVTIVQKDVTRDTLTPEPFYNDVPPTDGSFMFNYKDRIFVVTADGGLRYSGFESCYIGNPYESWPPLNQLFVPNRNDKAVGGISTQVGALIFGEKDSYIMTGFPSDKVSSPNNSIAVTEHIDPMNWNMGITYAKTAVSTPFGTIWTDQTKRIRLWNQSGLPAEIAQALRTELDAMTGALHARWFQHGKNGGYYILTDGTTMLFVMIYLSASTAQMQFGYGKSTSIEPEAMANVTFSNVERFFFVKEDQTYEILDPAAEGDGWAEGTEIFFKIVLGNTNKSMNFSSIHSLQISGNLQDLAITHAPMKETNPEDIDLTDDLEADTGTDGDSETLYGLVDSDERRYHVLKFNWGVDDRNYRNIDSFTANIREARRLI